MARNSGDDKALSITQAMSSRLTNMAPLAGASHVDQFKRAPIRRSSEHHESLLTMALQSHSDDDGDEGSSARRSSRRRQSTASNVSLASTAEFTCDTGITTPARTSSPSPRRTHVGCIPLAHANLTKRAEGQSVQPTQESRPDKRAGVTQQPSAAEPRKDPAIQGLEKKRCISFACAAKPVTAPAPAAVDTAKSKNALPEVIATDVPKRPCIKFACTANTTTTRHTPPKQHSKQGSQESKPPVPDKEVSPATVRKYRSPSGARGRHRSSTPRRSIPSPTLVRSKRYLTANTTDLQNESSRFHEFASDTPQEDDWIRQEVLSAKRKITINDTLEKENVIRKLANEAEEEAEMEEAENEEADETPIGDDGENPEEPAENDEDDDGDLPDHLSGYGSDDDLSDGYNSDNEGGFAESDGEDDKDGMGLWTLSRVITSQFSDATPVYRKPSIDTSHSDSSGPSRTHLRPTRSRKHGSRQLPGRALTPELPDSTDFVCGTLDEDRPIEEAYVSRIAARKRQNTHTIPQDIDPSFPTSDPEDDDDGIKGTGQDNEDHLWLHGEMEDLHHDQEAIDRRKKKGDKPISPKRYHSPPPKHRHAPAPHARGRSPVRLFEGQPLRRLQSPMEVQNLRSPPASPVHLGQHDVFKALAFRPGLTHTKSLPHTPAVAPIFKCRRARTGTMVKEKHVRGAVDIVLGLEQKRQRRKEKFYQKHCNRARKGQAIEKRPLPGQGAERMRELGLLMAGKLQGNYVLSV